MKKIAMIITAIVIPPLAVLWNNGAGKDLAINILLWMLFLVPAVTASAEG